MKAVDQELIFKYPIHGTNSSHKTVNIKELTFKGFFIYHLWPQTINLNSDMILVLCPFSHQNTKSIKFAKKYVKRTDENFQIEKT